MGDYFANVIKTGDPNGKGLPKWEPNKGDVTKSININVETKMEPIPVERYHFLDQQYSKK